MLIIELQPRQVSPAGAHWVEMGPVIGEGWTPDSNVGIPLWDMARRKPHMGHDELIWYAMFQGITELWIETDARRCR
jgi:hypothetical protein